MRFLVLGASGGCGGWFVRLALEQGHHITALLRHSSQLNREARGDIAVVRGEATDGATLEHIVGTGRWDAVVSCLGQRRAGFSPWARLLSPPDLMERVMKSLIPAMERHGLTRLVWISAGGVCDSYQQVTPAVRRLISSGNIALAYRDLEQAEALLAPAALDSLTIRPVTLWWGAPAGRGREVQRYGMFSMIRRADVADYMLRQVTGERPFKRKAVMIGQ